MHVCLGLLKKLPPKIQEFSRKKSANTLFISIGWAILTSVDESKRLNPAKSRIPYMTYCEVKREHDIRRRR
jgi:hypothetical protein